MSSTILIETFADARYRWYSVTDSVLHLHPQHRHYGAFSIGDGRGILKGEVKLVDDAKHDFHGPGSLAMKTGQGNLYGGGGNIMPDVSSCTGLQLVARSAVSYSGYRISFGSKHVPFLLPRRRGYQADFTLPADGAATTVTIPFDHFTYMWDGATGDALKTCTDDHDYCPDTANLRNMRTLTIAGQGVAGPVHLEVDSIAAVGCDEGAATYALHQRQEWEARKIKQNMASMHAFARKSAAVPRKSAAGPVQFKASSSHGSTHILVACVGTVVVALVFALIRRRRAAREECQGLDRFLVDFPQKSFIPL